MDCIWISSGVMLFLETPTTVVESLPVTMLSFTRVSSSIDHSSVTIFLPNSMTTSSSSSYQWLSQFMPPLITLLTTFYCPPFWTYSFVTFWTFSSLSRCIVLPLSLYATSFYQLTLCLFFFYYLSPSHSLVCSLHSPSSFLLSVGPYSS